LTAHRTPIALFDELRKSWETRPPRVVAIAGVDFISQGSIENGQVQAWMTPKP
jgi:hypothetical protein